VLDFFAIMQYIEYIKTRGNIMITTKNIKCKCGSTRLREEILSRGMDLVECLVCEDCEQLVLTGGVVDSIPEHI
jgi:hypothetical protein